MTHHTGRDIHTKFYVFGQNTRARESGSEGKRESESERARERARARGREREGEGESKREAREGGGQETATATTRDTHSNNKSLDTQESRLKRQDSLTILATFTILATLTTLAILTHHYSETQCVAGGGVEVCGGGGAHLDFERLEDGAGVWCDGDVSCDDVACLRITPDLVDMSCIYCVCCAYIVRVVHILCTS